MRSQTTKKSYGEINKSQGSKLLKGAIFSKPWKNILNATSYLTTLVL